jgi:hypothetical protein
VYFVKKPVTRLLAALALATVAVTGYALTDILTATPLGDSGWGAPDLTHTVTATDAGIVIDTTLGDSGWG